MLSFRVVPVPSLCALEPRRCLPVGGPIWPALLGVALLVVVVLPVGGALRRGRGGDR